MFIEKLATYLASLLLVTFLIIFGTDNNIARSEDDPSQLHTIFSDSSFSQQSRRLFYKLKQLEPLENSLHACLSRGHLDAKHYCIEMLTQKEIIADLEPGPMLQKVFEALAALGTIEDPYNVEDKLLAARIGELFTALAKPLCKPEARLPCKKTKLYPLFIEAVFERLFLVSDQTNEKEIKYNRQRFSVFGSVLYFSYPHSKKYMRELARHPDPRVRLLAAQTLSLKHTKIQHGHWIGEPVSKFEKNLAYNLAWDSDPEVAKKASFGRKWSK